MTAHGDRPPLLSVRGVETYYLNITHDRYAIRLAARENTHTGDDKRISDLQFILADLAMKSNVDESIRLGRQGGESRRKRLPLERRRAEVEDGAPRLVQRLAGEAERGRDAPPGAFGFRRLVRLAAPLQLHAVLTEIV